LFASLPPPWNVAAGVIISLFVCDRLKLNAGARSTLAAMIIILLRPEGSHLWDAALSRVLAVIVGCLIGLGITYVVHMLIPIEGPAINSEAVKREKEG